MRSAIAIVKEWYDLCHENPLDTRILKRLIDAELTARAKTEDALRERAEGAEYNEGLAIAEAQQERERAERAEAAHEQSRALVRDLTTALRNKNRACAAAEAEAEKWKCHTCGKAEADRDTLVKALEDAARLREAGRRIMDCVASEALTGRGQPGLGAVAALALALAATEPKR